MEKIKTCIYCGEIMTYGPQIQILCNSIIKDGKYINKSVKFIQYGWKCKMKEDDCDIIFDDKDRDTNKINSKEADKEVKILIHSSIK